MSPGLVIVICRMFIFYHTYSHSEGSTDFSIDFTPGTSIYSKHRNVQFHLQFLCIEVSPFEESINVDKGSAPLTDDYCKFWFSRSGGIAIRKAHYGPGVNNVNPVV